MEYELQLNTFAKEIQSVAINFARYHKQDAEDIAQEIKFEIWRYMKKNNLLDDGNDDALLDRPLVFKIAKNRANVEYRKRKKREEHGVVGSFFDDISPSTEKDADTGNISALQEHPKFEFGIVYDECLKELKATCKKRYKPLLNLVISDPYIGREEIGSLLDMPKQTVSDHFKYVTELIRNCDANPVAS